MKLTGQNYQLIWLQKVHDSEKPASKVAIAKSNIKLVGTSYLILADLPKTEKTHLSKWKGYIFSKTLMIMVQFFYTLFSLLKETTAVLLRSHSGVYLLFVRLYSEKK